MNENDVIMRIAGLVAGMLPVLARNMEMATRTGCIYVKVLQ